MKYTKVVSWKWAAWLPCDTTYIDDVCFDDCAIILAYGGKRGAGKAKKIETITPERRGCQLSLRLRRSLIAEDLSSGQKKGILIDVRKSDILRVGLTPL